VFFPRFRCYKFRVARKADHGVFIGPNRARKIWLGTSRHINFCNQGFATHIAHGCNFLERVPKFERNAQIAPVSRRRSRGTLRKPAHYGGQLSAMIAVASALEKRPGNPGPFSFD
jgi:hypothetical protein